MLEGAGKKVGGGGGGADKTFTRKGTVSTKRVRMSGAWKFEEGYGEESRNTQHEEIGKNCNEELQ
jgi:hypothetical protein